MHFYAVSGYTHHCSSVAIKFVNIGLKIKAFLRTTGRIILRVKINNDFSATQLRKPKNLITSRGTFKIFNWMTNLHTTHNKHYLLMGSKIASILRLSQKSKNSSRNDNILTLAGTISINLLEI